MTSRRVPADMQSAPQVGPALYRHQLGAQLRRLREVRSLRLEDVAARLEVVPSTLSRIETGKAPTRQAYLTVMLDLFGIDDPEQRELLAGLARAGQGTSWWAGCKELLPAGFGDYLDLEAAASRVCSYSVQTVPGLLQTGDYAAAAFQATWPGHSARQIRALVTLQLRRQDMILRSGSQLDIVIDESALHRSIGSRHMMADQLEHLLAAATDPKVSLRIAELGTCQPALSPPFTGLTFTSRADYDVACQVGHNGQVIITSNDIELRAIQRTFALLRDSATPLSSTHATDRTATPEI